MFFFVFSSQFFPWFYTDVQHFFKLPNVNNNCKQHTDIKFDVSQSFSALHCVFQCFSQSILLVRFTMMSNIFSSCPMISNTINDAPISNSIYLEVFPVLHCVFLCIFEWTFFIRLTLISGVFSSRLKISSTANDAPR